MVERVDRKFGSRPLTKEDFLEGLNRELWPGVEKIRLTLGDVIDRVNGMCFFPQDYGLKPDSIPAIVTASIQDAIDAADENGGGAVLIPNGTWTLATIGGNVSLSLTDKENVAVVGAGRNQTILTIEDGAECHIFNINGATNLILAHMTLDGNASGQTELVHCIRTGRPGCDGLSLFDLDVGNAKGYGLGLQGGTKKRIYINHVDIHDTGSDACDFKNVDSDNEDIVISNLTVKRWGQNTDLEEQAALDCRGPIKLVNFWATEGPHDGHYLRARDGEVGDAGVGLGGHQSSFANCHLIGNSGDASIGLYIAGREVSAKNIFVSSMFRGVTVLADRCTVAGAQMRDCISAGLIAAVGADYLAVSDCHSDANSTGFRVRSTFVSMSGCSSQGDTTAGIALESGASYFSSTGFTCTGTGGTMIGIDITSADATVTGGHVTACFRGASATGARPKFIGLDSFSNTDDGIILAAGSDDGLVTGCSLRSNSDDGITVRSDRARIVGNVITGNGGNGLIFEAGADDGRVDCNRFNGNGTALTDSATGTRVGLLNDGLPTPYLLSSVRFLAGTGDPTGVHTAPIGSLFLRTDGGAGTALYVNEDGTSAGWAAK